MAEAQTDTPRTIQLVVAYNGAAYHGWQRQAAGIDTVQQRLEEALIRVLGHPLSVHGAGRTDAGVHALGQAVSFRTSNRAIPLAGLRRAVNAKLPGDIAVLSAAEAPDGFHASLSATGKTYRYRLYIAQTRPVELHRLVWHYFWHPLDVERMQEAARRLVGRHDFAGFATSGDERDNTVRTVFACDVREEGPEVHVTVRGDGFLYNMVRNIVGTLVEVGRGHWPPERIDHILATADRTKAGPTAPPDGLTMVCVHYDQ